jgi:hypothetical protein
MSEIAPLRRMRLSYTAKIVNVRLDRNELEKLCDAKRSRNFDRLESSTHVEHEFQRPNFGHPSTYAFLSGLLVNRPMISVSRPRLRGHQRCLRITVWSLSEQSPRLWLMYCLKESTSTRAAP